MGNDSKNKVTLEFEIDQTYHINVEGNLKIYRLQDFYYMGAVKVLCFVNTQDLTDTFTMRVI